MTVSSGVELKFGTGIVKMRVGGEKGYGGLFFSLGAPSETTMPSDESIMSSGLRNKNDDVLVSMLFDKGESVDVVIEMLNKVRRIVDGTFATTSHCQAQRTSKKPT